jgi:hypothetical protein
MGAFYAYGSAAVWTDKSNYGYWETVTISGSGFNPNTNIVINITRPDSVVDTRSSVSDISGNFVYNYVLDGILGTYTVAASDGINSATATFTEANFIPALYGYSLEPPLGWTHGDVKGYYECQWVPFKIEMTTAGKPDSAQLKVVVHQDYFSGTWYGLDNDRNFAMWRNGNPVSPTIDGPQVDGWVSGIQQLEFNWTVTVNQDDNCTLYWETHVAIGAHNYPGSRVHTAIYDIIAPPGTPISQGNRDVPVVCKGALPTYPTTTATSLSANSIGLGGSVIDTITISTSASGTLPAASGTWTLYAANNVGMTGAITIGSGPVSGQLSFSATVTWTPPSAGDWYFQAVYSGDPYYVDSQSDPTTEHLVVNKAPTTTVTLLTPAGPITLGQSVTDKVTISTSATGTLPAATGTWTIYAADNPSMTGEVLIGSGAVSGALPFSATTAAFTPTHAGDWYFQAVYSGDSNYLASQSTPADEALVVGLAPTTTVTLLSPLGPITLGGSVTDKVTISTSATGTLPSATGTWTVYAADNSGMTGKVVVGTGSVSGALPFSATTAAFTPTHAGDWYFQAVYSGDSNYVGSQSDPATEHLSVGPATPTVSTSLSKTSITLGQSVTDTVTVTGLGGSFPVPTGTVTFYVKVPGGVSFVTFGAVKTLSGGSATSDSYTPLAVGTYYFKAVYSGDSNYASAASGDTDEPLTVSKALPVGGEWAPINAVQLPAPYIALGLIAFAALAAGSWRWRLRKKLWLKL